MSFSCNQNPQLKKLKKKCKQSKASCKQLWKIWKKSWQAQFDKVKQLIQIQFDHKTIYQQCNSLEYVDMLFKTFKVFLNKGNHPLFSQTKQALQEQKRNYQQKQKQKQRPTLTKPRTIISIQEIKVQQSNRNNQDYPKRDSPQYQRHGSIGDSFPRTNSSRSSKANHNQEKHIQMASSNGSQQIKQKIEKIQSSQNDERFYKSPILPSQTLPTKKNQQRQSLLAKQLNSPNSFIKQSKIGQQLSDNQFKEPKRTSQAKHCQNPPLLKLAKVLSSNQSNVFQIPQLVEFAPHMTSNYELSIQIQNYKQQIQKLEDSLATEKNFSYQLSLQIQNYKKCQDQFMAQRYLNYKLFTQVQDYQKRIRKLEDQLKIQQKQNQILQNQIKQQNAQIKQLLQKISSLKNKHLELQQNQSKSYEQNELKSLEQNEPKQQEYNQSRPQLKISIDSQLTRQESSLKQRRNISNQLNNTFKELDTEMKQKQRDLKSQITKKQDPILQKNIKQSKVQDENQERNSRNRSKSLLLRLLRDSKILPVVYNKDQFPFDSIQFRSQIQIMFKNFYGSQAYLKNPIKQTNMIYHFDNVQTKKFYESIKQNKCWVLVGKVSENLHIGGFVNLKNGLKSPTSQSFLFSLPRKGKPYIIKACKQIQNPCRPQYINFGDSEFRIKANTKKVHLGIGCFNFNYSQFDNQKPVLRNFSMNKGQDFELQSFQIHQIIFLND